MLIIGMIGKIGVFFASMPEPIIGGMYLVMFGIIAAVGISNLQVFLSLFELKLLFVISFMQILRSNINLAGSI